MLSDQHRAIVKATVPLLETGGETLTRHFYELMFNEHPEVRPFFNQTHQHEGRQQRALANSVLMYARHIDELEKLGDLVDVIVHKHVSLQIQPEHYPIVGKCLLRAIREVLGAEVATDEVLAAWGAAYQQLAEILIRAESTVYTATAEQSGGWRGARRFRVVRKDRESAEIVSLRLEPVDGGPVVAHRPGQYIGLRATVDGQDVRRNYSLSAAGDGVGYRISVKREPDGLVSKHLHDEVQVGSVLELFPPAGSFTLADSERPVVLISGGVGITPTLPMLEAALQTGRPVRFIHAARHAGVHAFRAWIDGLAARHPQLQRFYCYERHEGGDAASAPTAVGHIGVEHLAKWLPENRDVDVYFLGPVPFMRAIKKHLAALGVPESQTRHEFFGPAAALS
jgi:nitric oxide dioxygenase